MVVYKDVSNDPLMEILTLPPNLEPNPEVNCFHCLRCIRKWAHKDASTDILLESCERANPEALCSHCKNRRHGCHDVEPEFYRALNCLNWLRGEWSSNRINPQRKEDFVQCCHDFEATFKRYKSKVDKAAADAGGVEKYKHARQVSLDRNYERWQKGLGVIGKSTPTNVVVNKALEDKVYAHNVTPRDARWVWYGASAL